MPTAPTSLKLPASLKERLHEVADRKGQTPHTYMINALEDRVTQDELAQRFRQEARAADKAMQRSGKGYAADEVHAYIEAHLAGKKAKRPRARLWRK
jgi:predicted transcriptional regulator